MNGCFYLIKQFLPNLAPSERKIADFLLTQPAQAVELKITQLAKESQTSPAAIIRLANRLGYSGYSELRMNIAKEVFSTEVVTKESSISQIKEGDSAINIINGIVNITSSTIHGLTQVLDPNILHQVVDAIVKAKYILLSGIGASGIVATDFQQKLARLGHYALYTLDIDMQVVQACSLTKLDTLIAFSYSGESDKVLKVAKEAKKNNAKVIAITRIGGNSLSRIADYTIQIPNNESVFREGATLSRISQLLVVDIIYAMILTGSHGKATELLKRTWEAVSHISNE